MDWQEKEKRSQPLRQRLNGSRGNRGEGSMERTGTREEAESQRMSSREALRATSSEQESQRRGGTLARCARLACPLPCLVSVAIHQGSEGWGANPLRVKRDKGRHHGAEIQGNERERHGRRFPVKRLSSFHRRRRLGRSSGGRSHTAAALPPPERPPVIRKQPRGRRRSRAGTRSLCHDETLRA